jgi:PAS domain S-box-containing protein
MEDERKTKKQLIEELNELRQCVAKLQGFEEEVNQTRANQEKFTKAFRQNSIPVTITTVKEGRFVDVSDAFLRLVELKREEVIGHTSRETGFITEEQRTLFYNELSKNGRVENLEMEVSPRDRGLRYGLFNVVMMSFNNENYLLTTIQDITDRKHVELRLKETERKFRTIADFTYGWENWVGGDGKPLWISPSVERISGYSISECMTMPDYPFPIIHAEDRSNILAAMQHANERPLNDIEFRIIKKDGTLGWGAVSTNPVFTKEGNSVGHRSSIRDITARKQAEETMRENEAKYQLLFNASLDAIAVLGGTPPKFIFVNPAFLRLFGYSSEEILSFSGDDIFLLVHSEDREMVKNILKRRYQQEGVSNQYESRIVTKHGEVRRVEVSASLISNRGQLFSQAIYRDITDRKRAEEVLVQSEEKYRLITENIMDCIALVDEHGIIQYVTNSRETLGYGTEEMIGIPGLSITHLDDLERIRTLYREGIEKVWSESIFEMMIRHKDGHYVPMEIRARILADPQEKVRGGVFVARSITKNGQKKQGLLSGEKSLSALFDLSQREKEILNWVMQGKSSWDISTIINISESTVKFHINNLMKKLGAVNRTHAVAIAMREDLIS